MRKRHIKELHKESKILALVRGMFAIAVILVQLALPIAPVFADEVNTVEGATVVPESEGVTDESLEEVIESQPQELVTESADTPEIVDEESNTIFDDDAREIDSNSSMLSDGSAEEILEEDTPLDSGEDVITGEGGEVVSLKPEFDEVSLPDAIPEIISEIENAANVSPTEEVVDEGGQNEEQEVTGTTTETEEVATSSQNVVEPELHTVNLEESAYTFGLDDCARVADGSFYCTPKSEAREMPTDRVFAAPDSDGDNEIFIEKGGELSQLTHNLFDDAAPYYDERSNTIVFHRLTEARYQIFSLDVESLEETQLTHDSYNNMQPSRYDDLIVWQGWVGNDWEILMSNDGEVSMLTDNITHDIGPRINGEYIIWQAEEVDGWKVRIFNTLTGETKSIDDADGASIENPRLVLVYDAKHENGDIETRGYDLDTGKKVALAAQAGTIPDEIPDPDQTGEDRALITTTTQIKPKTDDDDIGEPEPLPLDLDDDIVASTTDALVIPQFSTVTSVESGTSISAPVELSNIPDIVILNAISEPTQPAVPDLVIPNFIQIVPGTFDSQEVVAGTL
jgi:hypothetical protein